MGIPDTYTMPLYDSQIFIARATAEQTTTTTNSSTQEHTPPCTQIFRTALFYNKQHKEQPDPPIPLNQDSSSSKNFTCEDIKKAINIKKFTAAEINKATGNYREQNIIGGGGQGTVYKGLLLPSNQLIAVKRPYHKDITKSSKMHQFLNEINLLSQINHGNVVKFLGCCFEIEIPSIVYEYIPNGTLYDHLFDKQNPCVLTWDHRLRIASQVAQALAYLHNTRQPILHRDIKSSNILLDDNFMAKVSDFGISHFGPCQDEFNTFIEHARELVTTHVSTGVMGTLGYIDPEYIRTRRATTKSDVYSFGVVLAELLTRKKPNYADWEAAESLCVEWGTGESVCAEWGTGESVCAESKTGESVWAESETGESFWADLEAGKGILVYKFLKKLKDDRLVEILDEQLVNEGPMEQLMKVAHLAGWCLESKGEDRPTMRQVVRDLQDISAISGQQMLMRAQLLWRNRQRTTVFRLQLSTLSGR